MPRISGNSSIHRGLNLRTVISNEGYDAREGGRIVQVQISLRLWFTRSVGYLLSNSSLPYQRQLPTESTIII